MGTLGSANATGIPEGTRVERGLDPRERKGGVFHNACHGITAPGARITVIEPGIQVGPLDDYGHAVTFSDTLQRSAQVSVEPFLYKYCARRQSHLQMRVQKSVEMQRSESTGQGHPEGRRIGHRRLHNPEGFCDSHGKGPGAG